MKYLELFSYTCYTISLRCMFICRKHHLFQYLLFDRAINITFIVFRYPCRTVVVNVFE